MGYRIGSFNVQHLTMNPGKVRDNYQAVKRIPEIIRKHAFDIVAFQEVNAADAMAVMVRELGESRWEAVHDSSLHEGSSDASKEYGYMWRKDKLRLVRDPFVYSEIKKRVDSIWQNHINLQIGRADELLEEEDALGANSPHQSHAPSVTFAERKRHMIETFKAALQNPPMVCCFRPGGCWKGLFWELRIINTHIVHGKGKGLIASRREEFKQIAGRMHTALNTLRFGNFRSVYTVIAGDYNLALPEISLASSDNDFKHACENHRMKTVQAKRTTLKKYRPDDNPPLEGEACYKSNYDHFSFDQNRLGSLVGNAKRVDVENFKKHINEISDHVPIYVDLNI